MDDAKWQMSADQLAEAYQLVKEDRDALGVKLRKICEAAMKVQRGCDCEYDHRCGRCDAVVELQNVLESMTRR